MGSADAQVHGGLRPMLTPTPSSSPSALTPQLDEAISEIAGVVGAWCPSLSPDGHRIAYVTDRSGLPRLEVAHLNAAGDTADRTPRQVSPAHQEVISVAWSPDGQWLAYLVSPGGLIRAELHVMRPDGSDARPLAGIDDRSTVLAGCWTALPNTYAFSLADGRGPGADVCLVDVSHRRGAHRCQWRIPGRDVGVAGRAPADRPARTARPAASGCR